MIQFNDIFQIVADSFFGGNVGLAGVVVLVGVLAFIMVLSKKLQTTLILAVPVIMMFALMGWLPPEIGLVMLVIISLYIAMETRGVFN